MTQKKTWSVINEIMNRKPKNKSQFEEIYDGPELVSGPENVANILNNHFINAPINIANSLSRSNESNFRDFLSGNYPYSFYLNSITPCIIEKIVETLNSNSNGSGYLGISTKVIKNIINLISTPLSIIFNKCINLGYFPKKLKIAEIVPIHKSGDPNLPNNYRSISILYTNYF